VCAWREFYGFAYKSSRRLSIPKTSYEAIGADLADVETMILESVSG